MNDDKINEILISVKALSSDIDNLVSVLEQIADKFDRHNAVSDSITYTNRHGKEKNMDNLIYKDKGAFCPMCNRMCEQGNCVMFCDIGDRVGGCAYAVTFKNFNISSAINRLNEKVDRHNELLQFIAEQVAK